MFDFIIGILIGYILVFLVFLSMNENGWFDQPKHKRL